MLDETVSVFTSSGGQSVIVSFLLVFSCGVIALTISCVLNMESNTNPSCFLWIARILACKFLEVSRNSFSKGPNPM